MPQDKNRMKSYNAQQKPEDARKEGKKQKKQIQEIESMFRYDIYPTILITTLNVDNLVYQIKD